MLNAVPRLAMLSSLCAFLVAACATTEIAESWTAPGLTAADLEFQHVVAIAIVPEPSRQRIVEDALAAAATRARVTPAYTILKPEDRADVDRLRTVLERHGIESCLLPIRGDGVHVKQEGSQKALQEYLMALQEDPTDLTTIWLMKLSSWPRTWAMNSAPAHS